MKLLVACPSRQAFSLPRARAVMGAMATTNPVTRQTINQTESRLRRENAQALAQSLGNYFSNLTQKGVRQIAQFWSAREIQITAEIQRLRDQMSAGASQPMSQPQQKSQG